ncbi:MAG: LysM domain-containing protein, partial [Sporolactobacillus sp.]
MKLYAVQQGDTITSIANKNGMTLENFIQLNGNMTDDALRTGMKVIIDSGVQPIPLRSEKPKIKLHGQSSIPLSQFMAPTATQPSTNSAVSPAATQP